MISSKLIERIKNAYYITVFSGGDFSKKSGVPAFSENDGSWNNCDIKKLASPETLQENPELFWQYYSWYLSQIKDIKPNLGHYALVDLERRYPGFSLITGNNDNLHVIAGTKKVQELFGNIKRIRCTGCGSQYLECQAEKNKIGANCPACSGNLRPDVVLNGESIADSLVKTARESSSQCEVFILTGALNEIEPITTLPYIAKANGAYLVEITKNKTEISDQVDELIIGDIDQILPHLVIQLEKVL